MPTRWEILKGLPGEGPVPLHFHSGHPTPWTEGLVVKFFADDDSAWVGNFQLGIGPLSTVVEWPDARTIVVVARGALYLFAIDDPPTYTASSSGMVEELLIDPNGDMLFVADDGDVAAFRCDRKIAWRKEGVGAPGIEFDACLDGVLSICAEHEMGEPWVPLQLEATTGATLDDPSTSRSQLGNFVRRLKELKWWA